MLFGEYSKQQEWAWADQVGGSVRSPWERWGDLEAAGGTRRGGWLQVVLSGKNELTDMLDGVVREWEELRVLA